MKAGKVVPMVIGGGLLIAAAWYSKAVRAYLFSCAKTIQTKVMDYMEK